MAITYPITLSTTEPNSNIGLLKIRQADEETQTLDVTLLESGNIKSYEGLQVFFCARIGQTAGLGIIEQKLTEAEMTDPKNGRFEYTFRAEDWQILGRQTGYFSFRKMTDDHTYVQQFSTRDFTYEVTKSIYSDGIKEVTKDGSTYVWTIEDLIRLFNEYIASGKSDWEDFVEQNKEIIESVDPGGQVLTELITARGGYSNLDKRFVEQIGTNTDFRNFESQLPFMLRIYNEQVERGRNIRWYGAKPNDATLDSYAGIQEAMNLGGKVVFPKGTYYVSDTIIWDVYTTAIDNFGATIIPTFDTAEKPVIKFISTHYGNRQAQRNMSKSGLEIRGNGSCVGIELDNPNPANSELGVLAHIDFHNFVIRDCAKTVVLGSNTYMVTFKSCEFGRSKKLICIKDTIINAGERIAFEDCNLTGSWEFEDSMVIEMLTYYNLYFINCSIDWNKNLGIIRGIVHFVSCHIESPGYALSATEPFLKLEGNGQLIMDGGTFMLNNDSNASERIDIARLISSTLSNQSISIEKTVWAVPNLKLLSDGPARVNFKPIFTQGYSTDVVHFLISNATRQNVLLNKGFDRAGTTTTNLYDDWQNAYGWQLSLESSDSTKVLRFTSATAAERKIYLAVPFDPNNSLYFSSLFEVYSSHSNVITDASVQLYSDNLLLGEYSVGAIAVAASGWRTIRIPQLLFGKSVSIKRVTKVRLSITCKMPDSSFIQFKNPMINMC